MKTPKPPRWADKFLEWYCRPELLEEIQGDIYEVFDIKLKQVGPQAASRHFIWNVLRSFRLSTIRQLQLLSTIMIKSNLTIAFRQMSKQKLFSAIKIGGFALGIAACLLIALYIKDELSYDKHHPDSEQIYRVYVDFLDCEVLRSGAHFPAPMAKTILEGYPEVAYSARFNANPLFDGPGSNELRRRGSQRNTFETGFTYADQGILDIFQFPFIHGDSETALSEPNSIVISESKARKYFPDTDPIGQTLILNDQEDKPFKITGVLEEFPTTSHIQYDFFLSLAGVEFWSGEQDQWSASNYFNYIKTKPGVDSKELEVKLEKIIEEYFAPQMVESGFAASVEELLERSDLRLQEIDDVYLKSAHVEDGQSYGDIRFVWLFGMIALFILLLACINFINLSTAKSANRAKEVGVRKVLGSVRSNLVNQFLTESLLYSFFSFALGTLLAYQLLPFFNLMASKTLVFPWAEWWLIPLLVLATITIGFLAGLYPSFYLSAFRPMEVLKGELSKGSKSSIVQNGLVVFQFTTAIVLIVSTFVIYRQMNFILNKKLGFEKDQIVLIQGAQTLGDKIYNLKDQLLQLPSVKNVSVSDYLPVSGTKRNGNSFRVEGRDKTEKTVPGQIWRTDHDYLKTMGITLLAGRDFNIDMPTDSQAVIINQSMAEKLNLEDPVGQSINNGFQDPFPIIGVMKDFHFESFKDVIRPLCITIGNSPETISIKVNSENMASVVPALTAVWNEFSPNQPIRYSFLDERFAAMYADVQRMSWVFSSFAILAIVVACLGLFALAAFMAQQRSKEMSIRKVLGASIPNIFRLLTQNFIKLIIISLCLAAPLAWYLMRRWLEDYNYSIEITTDVFVYAGLSVLLISLITISYQAFKTAVVSPAEAIRKE